MAGFILWEGASLYDGKPIVVIATLDSRNKKTGDMISTWVLLQDVNPIEASRTGQDASICGNCPHMGKPVDKATGWAESRSCYVNLLHGPLPVWKAYKKGVYPRATQYERMTLAAGRMVRIGSYGDPAAVPVSVWQALVRHAKGWTAYTHASVNPLPDMLMTSADTLGQAESAWDKGERTFRVVSSVSELVKGKESLCPASEEAGKRSTCETCRLCNGSLSKAKSIAIVAHGNGKKHINQEAQASLTSGVVA
jgi:hypothetical protein